MVECNLAKVEVAGSNPVSRSIYFCPCSPEGWSEGFSFDPFPLRKRLTIDTQHSRVRLTTVLLRSHSIDEHIFTFMKKARRNPGLFHFVAEEKSGEGRGNLSEERFPLPQSLPPNTFDFIESLFRVSLRKRKAFGKGWRWGWGRKTVLQGRDNPPSTAGRRAVCGPPGGETYGLRASRLQNTNV